MKEKDIEKLFCDEVVKAGGRAYKFVSPGNSGVPDRLVILPGGKIGFVELKAPGKKTRPEQSYQLRKLADQGCYVTVLDKPECIKAVIHQILIHESRGEG